MADHAKKVEEYFAERPEVVAAELESLRKLIFDVLPEAMEIFRYGAPVYNNRHGTEVIYLYGGKNHANLGFVRGIDLDDRKGILKGKGKSGRHIKIIPGVDRDDAALRDLIRQCGALR